MTNKSNNATKSSKVKSTTKTTKPLSSEKSKVQNNKKKSKSSRTKSSSATTKATNKRPTKTTKKLLVVASNTIPTVEDTTTTSTAPVDPVELKVFVAPAESETSIIVDESSDATQSLSQRSEVRSFNTTNAAIAAVAILVALGFAIAMFL